MQILNSRSRLPGLASPPRRAERSAPQPAPNPDRFAKASVEESSSTLGWLGKASLAVVGLMSATCAIAPQPAQAAQLDLSLEMDGFRCLDFEGNFGGQNVDLEFRKSGYRDNDLKGRWANKRVDLEFDETGHHQYKIAGDWGNKKVDLEASDRVNHFELEGKWGDAKVDLEITDGWRGRSDIEGTWNGKRVELDVCKDSNGEVEVEGTFAGKRVNFEVEPDGRDEFCFDGESSEEAAITWILAAQLLNLH